MNNSTDNKNNTKAAKIAVLKKYAIPLVAILPLQFVIMSFGIRNDMQFIFFIFCFACIFFLSFVFTEIQIASGSKRNRKLWWLPATLITIVLVFIVWVAPMLSSDTEYEKAEKTFDSWVNTDPNTWTDAQTDYFNDVMNYKNK